RKVEDEVDGALEHLLDRTGLGNAMLLRLGPGPGEIEIGAGDDLEPFPVRPHPMEIGIANVATPNHADLERLAGFRLFSGAFHRRWAAQSRPRSARVSEAGY